MLDSRLNRLKATLKNREIVWEKDRRSCTANPKGRQDKVYSRFWQYHQLPRIASLSCLSKRSRMTWKTLPIAPLIWTWSNRHDGSLSPIVRCALPKDISENRSFSIEEKNLSPSALPLDTYSAELEKTSLNESSSCRRNTWRFLIKENRINDLRERDFVCRSRCTRGNPFLFHLALETYFCHYSRLSSLDRFPDIPNDWEKAFRNSRD